MAAAPLVLPPSAASVIASELARRSPQVARDLGVTAATLGWMAATTVPLAEAEQLGWISAAERRLYQGDATLEDLRTLGYDDAEARSILDEQRQDRACASSS